MKLLAIGGPEHGKELPYREGQRVLVRLVIPDIRTTRAVRLDLYEDVSITTATYERRVVSDRVVWVFVA